MSLVQKVMCLFVLSLVNLDIAVVRGMTMALFLGVNVVVSADEMELVKLFLSFFCNWFSIK